MKQHTCRTKSHENSLATISEKQHNLPIFQLTSEQSVMGDQRSTDWDAAAWDLSFITSTQHHRYFQWRPAGGFLTVFISRFVIWLGATPLLSPPLHSADSHWSPASCQTWSHFRLRRTLAGIVNHHMHLWYNLSLPLISYVCSKVVGSLRWAYRWPLSASTVWQFCSSSVKSRQYCQCSIPRASFISQGCLEGGIAPISSHSIGIEQLL